MSRQDPGAATGQQPYELGRCECGELETLHILNDAGERRACSASMCACRRYVAVHESAEAVSRGDSQ